MLTHFCDGKSEKEDLPSTNMLDINTMFLFFLHDHDTKKLHGLILAISCCFGNLFLEGKLHGPVKLNKDTVDK